MPVSMQSSVCTPQDPECAEQGGHQGSSGCPGPQQSPGDVPTEPQGCPQGSTGMAQLCPQAMQVPRWGQRRGDSSPEVSPAEPQAAPTAGANPACPSSPWLSQPWGQSLQPLCLQKRFKQRLCPSLGCPRAGQREEPAGFGLSLALLPAMLVNSGIFEQELPIFCPPLLVRVHSNTSPAKEEKR